MVWLGKIRQHHFKRLKSQKNGMYLSNLFKSGDKNNCNNYRGISLCSCIWKLFSKLITNLLVKKLNEENILSDKQAGFRQENRTSDTIFILKTLIEKNKTSNKKLYTAFIDLSKAFDSIWHKGLFYKLFNIVVGGKFYELNKNIYSTNHVCIRSNNIISEPILSKNGVKQGDILSPTLFNISLNDIDLVFKHHHYPVKINNKKFNHLAYADDIVLISETSYQP